MLSVLGQAYLLVQHGAVVVGLDDNRRRQHEGAENHQRQRRADNIHRPLDERILRAEHGAARFHDGDAEGLHMLRSGDDHVANVGDEVARHVLVDAGLRDAVAQRRIDTGHDHRLAALQLRQNFEHVVGIPKLADDVKAIFKEDNLVQFFQVFFVLVDDQRLHGLVQLEVDLVRRKAPQPADRRLRRQHEQHGNAVQQTPLDQTSEQIGQRIADQVCQRQGVKRFSRAVHADFVGVIGLVQENRQNQITEENGCSGNLSGLRCYGRAVQGQPCDGHHRNHQNKMKQIHAPHSHGLRHLGHFPLPPLYAASAAHPSGKDLRCMSFGTCSENRICDKRG